MEDKKKCLCGSSDVRVVACSGASNVGQIANQAALELAKANVARILLRGRSGSTHQRNGQIRKGSGSDGGLRRMSFAVCCQNFAAR